MEDIYCAEKFSFFFFFFFRAIHLDLLEPLVRNTNLKPWKEVVSRLIPEYEWDLYI